MTVGPRIAQRRRELGLSQEALGERLGVSRQAIYKWESDAALPEIEKLVNLSREFSVSIDWLLGQEDGDREPRELTPEQLRMVEEIVGRYLAARPPEPAPQLPRRVRTWPWVLGAAATILVLLVFGNMFARIDQLALRNANLNNSIGQISRDVNSQINSIARRVEEVLQDQNRLTAEQSAQVASTNYQNDTVTIEARAIPRTYVEGMTAEFILTSGGETITVPAQEGPDHAFTARLTGPLTDEVIVSAAFLTEGQRETQVVERFSYLYTYSWPYVRISDGAISWPPHPVAASWANVSIVSDQNTRIVDDLRVGIFRAGKLLAWYKEVDHGSDVERYFSMEEEIPIEPDVCYTLAAVLIDEYGHEWVEVGNTMTLRENGEVDYYAPGPEPSELIY